MEPRTVVITGCSQGGLGDALAQAFWNHASKGYRVIATARNPAKIQHLAGMGIETITLDVVDPVSIRDAVTEIEKRTGGRIDILLNNAGGGYNAPLIDADVQKVRELFDLNVISIISVTQAFFPLLHRQATHVVKRRKGLPPVIAIHTSIASMSRTPTQGSYCATKAAAAMLAETLRAEVEGFGIKVVDLRSGQVKSRFFDNMAIVQAAVAGQNGAVSEGDEHGGGTSLLPSNSIYRPGLEMLRPGLTGEGTSRAAQDASEWARDVVNDLSKSAVPDEIWRGGKAFSSWVAWFLPRSFMARDTDEITGMAAFWRFWEKRQQHEGSDIADTDRNVARE